MVPVKRRGIVDGIQFGRNTAVLLPRPAILVFGIRNCSLASVFAPVILRAAIILPGVLIGLMTIGQRVVVPATPLVLRPVANPMVAAEHVRTLLIKTVAGLGVRVVMAAEMGLRAKIAVIRVKVLPRGQIPRTAATVPIPALVMLAAIAVVLTVAINQ